MEDAIRQWKDIDAHLHSGPSRTCLLHWGCGFGRLLFYCAQTGFFSRSFFRGAYIRHFHYLDVDFSSFDNVELLDIEFTVGAGWQLYLPRYNTVSHHYPAVQTHTTLNSSSVSLRDVGAAWHWRDGGGCEVWQSEWLRRTTSDSICLRYSVNSYLWNSC